MAYKNKKDQLACQRRHYARNREVISKKNSDRKKEIRKWWKDYKSTLSCIKCGENHPACISFHHRDQSEKEVNLSEAACNRGWGKERIMKEVEKCDILCSNCHRKIHWIE